VGKLKDIAMVLGFFFNLSLFQAHCFNRIGKGIDFIDNYINIGFADELLATA
jgi:hypothetical protein